MTTVHEYGDRSLPAAVIAHGVGSSAEFVARCFAGPLAVAGLRLVTYDLRSHGTLDQHAEDLAAVLRATGARVAGGISLGAHAALRLCDGAADRLLLAIPGSLHATAAANLATADELAARGVAGTLARVAAEPGVPRWVVGELRRSWPQHDPAGLVAAFTALAAEAPVAYQPAVPTAVATVTDDPAHPFVPLPGAQVATLTMAEWGADRAAIGRAVLAASLTGSR